MDNATPTEDIVTWIVLGTVIGILMLMGLALYFCVYWQRHSNNFRALLMDIPFLQKYLTPTRRDSLDDLEEERATHSQNLRQWRRDKLQGVVGVKTTETIITRSGPSGYRWKKKWRDRKKRSKERRKLKHLERKKRRAEQAHSATEDSSDESSDASSQSQSSTSVS